MKKIMKANESFQIELDDKRKVNKGQVFGKDEDLTGKVNPVILKQFRDKIKPIEVVPYTVSIVQTLARKKIIKANEFRTLRDNAFSAGDITIHPDDVKRYLYLMIGTPEEIAARLPKTTSGGVKIETYEQMQAMLSLYEAHQDLHDKKIQACKAATTQEQLDGV